MLGVYEQRRIEALRDVYLWAYQRSAERYRAIVQSLGEPDAFRLKYREALREVVRAIVQEGPSDRDLAARVAAAAGPYAPAEERPRFQSVALQELENLNEGTFARYRLRPPEFAVRKNSADIQKNSVDIQALAEKLDTKADAGRMATLEQRVEVLEA